MRGALQDPVHVRRQRLCRERIALRRRMPIVGKQVELVGVAARLPQGGREINGLDPHGV